MRAVNRRTFILILAGVVSLFSTASRADERDDAIAAAKVVIAALAENKIDLIWDTLASDWYKYKIGHTREMFIFAFTSARRQIGRLTSSTVAYVRYDAPQPAAGYKGKTYTVTFENVYTTGTRYESVHLHEENGQFKMAGMG
jgi:hypothetical protein